MDLIEGETFMGYKLKKAYTNLKFDMVLYLATEGDFLEALEVFRELNIPFAVIRKHYKKVFFYSTDKEIVKNKLDEITE